MSEPSVKPYERYSPAAVEPLAYDESVVGQAVVQHAGHSSEGQQFSGLHVAHQTPAKGAIIRLNSLFGDTGTVDQQYIATQYASALPSHDYLCIDLPGHGMSDGLTRDQRRAVKAGNLGSVSMAQVEAATDIMPHLDELIVVGEAVGGLMALEFATQAARMGLRVRHLFDIDPMGLERRTPIALAANYLANAQKSRIESRRLADEAGEQRLENAFKTFEIHVAKTYGSTKHATQPSHVKKMAKERAILTFMLRSSLFTSDIGMTMLEKKWGAENVDLLFGGRSVVGRPTDSIMAALQAKRTVTHHLQYSVWPHDNQDLGLAKHQPRVIRYIHDRITARS